MSRSAPLGAPGETRGVLSSSKPLRRLWAALSLSSLGDWFGLLVLLSLAAALTADSDPLIRAYAVAGAAAVKLAPPLLLSPLAGLLADRFDRRMTMAAADAARALLYLSIPLAGRLDWLLIAGFLAELAALAWTPAKDAALAEAVPKRKLDRATRLGVLTFYGAAPVAGVLFAALASMSWLLGALLPGGGGRTDGAFFVPQADAALYTAGVAFLAAALAAWVMPKPRRRLVEASPTPAPAGTGTDRARPSAAPAGPAAPPNAADNEPTSPIAAGRSADDEATAQMQTTESAAENERTTPIATGTRSADNEATAEMPPVPQPAEAPAADPSASGGAADRPAAAPPAAEPRYRPENLLRTVWQGGRFAGTTPFVRGLLAGMVSVFPAVAAVVGVARLHVTTLGAGNAGFGVLFAAVFAGMGLGVVAGPRILHHLSRPRLFSVSMVVAALALLAAGLIPNMVMAAVLVALVGGAAGITWATGVTLLHQELEDDIRTRTLGYLDAVARTELLVAVVAAPLIAAVVGDYTVGFGDLDYEFLGTGAVLLITGVLVVSASLVVYRRVDTGGEAPLTKELFAALRGVPLPSAEAAPEESRLPGTFIVLEGGEGAGKSTQAGRLSVWLREEGFEVVTTREPGSTKLGMRLRALLLDREHTGMSARAEALLYAADRAEHVSSVILPALRRGAIVISDRYVDSTLAYQGAGRELARDEIERVNEWATEDLAPHLTVLLDIPPDQGLARLGGSTDRMEAESEEFHARVRQGFRELAERDPSRYLVVDGRESAEEIGREIRRRLRPLLPDPVPQDAEAITGMMPTIKE
ncbi:dTMP kinase [Streptomonospora wellingtoniae]|uniref:Thymidylate kinase n=1 Tax=Streptomonospora wellingtoniae TaxID=3075544 RepID=A0ABU2KMW1_9ACTN|nr:dTMP kinase [Streptomonospora sp. DSM 45055]MDT0300594.1 dTMP kinase [Streptomonospora sp. DSM 45055]